MSLTPNARPANPRIEAEKVIIALKIEAHKLAKMIRQQLDNVIDSDKVSDIKKTLQQTCENMDILGEHVNDQHKATDLVDKLKGILQDLDND